MKSDRRLHPPLGTERVILLPQLNASQRNQSVEGDLPFARAVSANQMVDANNNDDVDLIAEKQIIIPIDKD